MKKLLLIVLCILLTVPAFSLASSDAANDDPIDVTWLMMSFGNIDFANPEMKLYQWMDEVANIKLQPVVVPEDSYASKFTVLMASNGLPDIIYTGKASQKLILEYGPQGMFVPLSDYFDQLPAVKKYLDEYEDQARSIYASDGKLYRLPLIYLKDTPTYSRGIVLREDLLKAGGMEPSDIKTTEDLYRAFEIIYEQNGDKPVISARSNLTNMNYLANVFGGSFVISFNPEKNDFEYPVYSEATYNAVEFLHKMYENNLLHPDWASMSDAVWEQMVASGSLGGYFDNMVMLALRNQDLALSVGEGAKLVPIFPPTYNGVFHPWPTTSKIVTTHGIAVNAKATGEKLNRILKLVNWLYDFDASNVKLHYGEEGVTFVYRDDGTPKYIVDPDWENGNGPLAREYAIGTNNCNFHFIKDNWRLFDVAVTPPDENPLVPALEMYKDVYTTIIPSVTFTGEENERLGVILTPLTTYLNENLIQFINGTRPLSEWDSFVSDLHDMSIDEVEDIYNTAYHRLYN